MKPWIAVFLLTFLNCECTKAQIITHFAGGGVALGDNGPASAAQTGLPVCGSFDGVGNYYFWHNASACRIRKITPYGIITTVAGTGTNGYSGDGGAATAAQIQTHVVTVDVVGNVYMTDRWHNVIRKIDHATGIINTIAGTGSPALSGVGGLAAAMSLLPLGICCDSYSNLYVCANGYVLKIDAITTVVSIVGGDGIGGFSGDGGPATAAGISCGNICIDEPRNCLYVGGGLRVRRINLSTGIVNSTGGTGIAGYNGDEILATAANFRELGISVDDSGNVYIADDANNRIRKIDTFGVIHTVAGNGVGGYSGDGGPANGAQIWKPQGVAFDECGNLYIADDANHRIRRVNFSPGTVPYITISLSPNDTICTGTPVTYEASMDGVTTPVYQWYVNSIPVSGGTSYTYTPATGDSVSCRLTGTAACSGNTITRYSNFIRMVVNPVTSASITVTPSPNDTICAGTAVTFTRTSTGGGTAPFYQWYVNTAAVMAGSSYTYTPADDDSVRCIMVSNALCPSDDTVRGTVSMTVLPFVTPAVSITSSIGDVQCAGDTVLFTATPVNGGLTPAFQWIVNGLYVGTSATTYIYAPANGDSVRCLLTTSELCPAVATVSSNMIDTILVTPLTVPTVSVTGPVAAAIGSVVTVNATVVGTATYNIKWFRNAVLFSTTTTPVTTYTKSAGTDDITARVLPADDGCFDSAMSAIHTITVLPGGAEFPQMQSSAISIYPNPADEVLVISAGSAIRNVTITNLLGNVITSRGFNDSTIKVSIMSLPAGIFLLQVIDVEGVRHLTKFLKK